MSSGLVGFIFSVFSVGGAGGRFHKDLGWVRRELSQGGAGLYPPHHSLTSLIPFRLWEQHHRLRGWWTRWHLPSARPCAGYNSEQAAVRAHPHGAKWGSHVSQDDPRRLVSGVNWIKGYGTGRFSSAGRGCAKLVVGCSRTESKNWEILVFNPKIHGKPLMSLSKVTGCRFEFKKITVENRLKRGKGGVGWLDSQFF